MARESGRFDMICIFMLVSVNMMLGIGIDTWISSTGSILYLVGSHLSSPVVKTELKYSATNMLCHDLR